MNFESDPEFLYWMNQPLYTCERCQDSCLWLHEVLETSTGVVCAECLSKAMMGCQNYNKCPVEPTCNDCLREGARWKHK